MLLTDAKIRSLLPGSKDRYLADGGNLYLRIRTSGVKSWVVRKRIGQRVMVTTLGRYPTMSLRDARQKLRNLDPRAAAHALTVGGFLRSWFDDYIAQRYRKPHHVKGYLDRLEAEEPSLWTTKLRDVEHVLVYQALKRHVKGHGPIAANRLTSVLKTAFRFAVHAGYLSASPIAALSTAIVGGPDRARDRVLTDDEIRKLWFADAPHQALLRFLLITGQRIGETQAARWPDIRDGVWNIPADHTKSARAHWVPLPDLAQAIISSQNPNTRSVFGRTSSTAVQAWMKRWCARHGIDPPFTPHDLRRTFTTRLNDLGVAPHVVEKMLNHSMQGVMAVYNRAEYAKERKAAATTWADSLATLVSSAERQVAQLNANPETTTLPSNSVAS